MAEEKKTGFSSMNLAIVGVIALVAIVSVVALVLPGRTAAPAGVQLPDVASSNIGGQATRPLGSGPLATKYDNELLKQMADDAIYAVGRANDGDICSYVPEEDDNYWTAVETCEALMNQETGNNCPGCYEACQNEVLDKWPRC